MKLGLGLAVCAVSAVACVTGAPGSPAGACTANNECSAGQVCVDSACATVCITDVNCDGSCCNQGICAGTCADRKIPEITDIDGTGPTDGQPDHVAHRLQDRITITGKNFTGAGVSLESGSTAVPLDICDATDTQITALLPSNVTAQTYNLRVANQAGSCAVTASLLQGANGPSGPSGPAGQPGFDGQQGPTGPSGPSGAAGSDATVTGSANVDVTGGVVSLTNDVTISGTMTAGDLLYAAPSTRYAYAQGPDFHGGESVARQFQYSFYGQNVYASPAGGRLMARIPVPGGASVTGFECYIDDLDGTNDATIYLAEGNYSSNAPTERATGSSTGSAGGQTVVGTLAGPLSIDSNDILIARVDGTRSGLYLRGCRVTYTVGGPD